MSNKWFWEYEGAHYGLFESYEAALADATAYGRERGWFNEDEGEENFVDDHSGWDVYINSLDESRSTSSDSSQNTVRYQWDTSGVLERIDGYKIKGTLHNKCWRSVPDYVETFEYETLEEARKERERWMHDHGCTHHTVMNLDGFAPIREVTVGEEKEEEVPSNLAEFLDQLENRNA